MTCVLGYANQIDVTTLSGGNWNASYPLANLKNRYLNQKARSSNALEASTVINLDLGSIQRIGVVALCSHNLSESATVRIQASSSNTMSPSLFDSTAETIYSGADYAKTFEYVEARYWRISISDTGNTDGYVELGRIFVGWRFRPAINIDWSPKLAIESRTNVAEALAGPEYFDERPNRRVWQATWSWLTDYEAHRVLLDLQRNQDVSGEVYLIAEDTDTLTRGQKWFLGRFRTLSSIEHPYLNLYSAGVEVGELL